MTSVAQKIRQTRAGEQYASYEFRKVKIAGRTAVYVLSPSGSIYTVNCQQRCNCPDAQRRGGGTGCKHVTMAVRFLNEEKAAASAAKAAQMARDFPAD